MTRSFRWIASGGPSAITWPSSMTMTRSLIDMTTSMSCSMTRTVTPRSARSSRIWSRSCSRQDGRHAGHRLVEQDHPRLDHQRPRQLEQLSLAAGKRAGIGIGKMAQADERRWSRAPGLRTSASRAATRRRREERQREPLPRLVLGGEHACCRARSCWSGRAASGRRARGRRGRWRRRASVRCVGRRSAIDPASARRKPETRLKSRRLPGAVRADQGGDRALGDVEGGVADRGDAAEGLADPAHVEKHRLHLSRSSWRRLPRMPCGRSAMNRTSRSPTRNRRRKARDPESKSDSGKKFRKRVPV